MIMSPNLPFALKGKKKRTYHLTHDYLVEIKDTAGNWEAETPLLMMGDDMIDSKERKKKKKKTLFQFYMNFYFLIQIWINIRKDIIFGP